LASNFFIIIVIIIIVILAVCWAYCGGERRVWFSVCVSVYSFWLRCMIRMIAIAGFFFVFDTGATPVLGRLFFLGWGGACGSRMRKFLSFFTLLFFFLILLYGL